MSKGSFNELNKCQYLTRQFVRKFREVDHQVYHLELNPILSLISDILFLMTQVVVEALQCALQSFLLFVMHTIT